MFFAPIFSSIPGFATGPALIVVGTMMMGHACEIDWDDLKVAFPAFLTIVLMPLTYSIAYGVLTGILANIVLWLFFGIIDMVLAAVRRDGVNTPGSVFYAMFQCWRDAFEDFIPGLKAEWKAVFKNKVRARWCRWTCCSQRCACYAGRPLPRYWIVLLDACQPVLAPAAQIMHCQTSRHLRLPCWTGIEPHATEAPSPGIFAQINN